MDSKQLKINLKSFSTELKKIYPEVRDIILENNFSGYFDINLIAPNIPDNRYYTAIADAVDLLWDEKLVNEETRKSIVKVCVIADVYSKCQCFNEELIY